jgi:hypothetical protein
MCGAQWMSRFILRRTIQFASVAAMMTHFRDSSITPQKAPEEPARIFTLLRLSLWRHGVAAQKRGLALSH